jgi:hypothetical protein
MKRLALFVVALVAALGCTPYATFREVPIDCDVEAQYDLSLKRTDMLRGVDEFDMLSPAECGTTTPSPQGCPGWTAGDGSPRAKMTASIETTPEPRCGNTAALVVRSDRNHEWGSLFGLNSFSAENALEYEGMSFWARVADHKSNTAFSILIDDLNSFSAVAAVCDADAGAPPPPADGGVGGCKNYCNDGGMGTGVIDGTGMLIPGTVGTAPEPDQCGNSFLAVVVVTPYWRFYTIPFTEFHQDLLPNRAPNEALTIKGPVPGSALRTGQLTNFRFRMPKAMRTELWFDNLGFYRKATATGGDGGVDAP